MPLYNASERVNITGLYKVLYSLKQALSTDLTFYALTSVFP